MSGFTFLIESEELGRLFTNALAFFPARSPVKTALIRVWPETIEVTGTDTLTIGRDIAEIRHFESEATPGDYPLEVELDREGWQDIDKQARKDKGNTGRVRFVPGDALIFHPGGNKADKGSAQDCTGQATVLVHGETLESADVWTLCDRLLERLTEREPETPDYLTFDPALFTRFNKVKTPADWDGDKVIDFAFQGQAEPMLAKIGPSFIGAIMPIDRAEYAAQQGDEGQEALW